MDIAQTPNTNSSDSNDQSDINLHDITAGSSDPEPKTNTPANQNMPTEPITPDPISNDIAQSETPTAQPTQTPSLDTQVTNELNATNNITQPQATEVNQANQMESTPTPVSATQQSTSESQIFESAPKQASNNKMLLIVGAIIVTIIIVVAAVGLM